MGHDGGGWQRVVAWAAVPALALLLLGCSSSTDTSTTGTTQKATTSAPGSTAGTTPGTSPSSTAAQTEKFDKEEQEALKKVGCYTGAIDGILGPQTDAALVAYQTAKGLTPDGILGPETDSALLKDASAGTKVCGSGSGSTSTTSSGGGSTTSTTPSGVTCTATSFQTALPAGAQITTFVCSGGYAVVTAQTTQNPGGTAYILKQGSSGWTIVPSDQVCGAASAGLPPVILQDGCTKSSVTPSTSSGAGSTTTKRVTG